MNQLIRLGVLFLACSSVADAEQGRPRADQIIDRYLALPFPDEDRLGESRQARLKVMADLAEIPVDAVPAIERRLPTVKSPGQRAELTEVLARITTRESAAVLVKLLEDPDRHVRNVAISGLRHMARRTDRVGPDRRVREDGIVPRVPGLLPYLLQAAKDDDESNRGTALYALADTRERAAVAALRARLHDTSDDVRLITACLLTEFQDASGLPEMRRALERLRKADRRDVRASFAVDRLLPSFERITGKSFGPIPMNPMLFSNSEGAKRAEQGREPLLDIWAAWWTWEPPAATTAP